MKISDPLGKVYTHTMFKKRSYDMRGGNGNGGDIPEGKYIWWTCIMGRKVAVIMFTFKIFDFSDVKISSN